jgi:hypothetical protein
MSSYPGGSTETVVISSLPGKRLLVWLLLKGAIYEREWLFRSGAERLTPLSVHPEEAEMGWFEGMIDSSLSIERLLKETKEKNRIDLKKKRLEQSGFSAWKIWKLLRIDWK